MGRGGRSILQVNQSSRNFCSKKLSHHGSPCDGRGVGSKWRPGDAVGAEWSEANTGDEGPVIETAPGKLRSCTRWDPGPRGGDDDSIVEVALDGGSLFWWTVAV